jgi:hypothetical protein
MLGWLCSTNQEMKNFGPNVKKRNRCNLLGGMKNSVVAMGKSTEVPQHLIKE